MHYTSLDEICSHMTVLFVAKNQAECAEASVTRTLRLCLTHDPEKYAVCDCHTDFGSKKQIALL